MKVFLARAERDSGVSVVSSMEGGARSGLRVAREAARVVSLDSERPAMAHFRVDGRCVVMYSAVYLPV